MAKTLPSPRPARETSDPAAAAAAATFAPPPAPAAAAAPPTPPAERLTPPTAAEVATRPPAVAPPMPSIAPPAAAVPPPHEAPRNGAAGHETASTPPSAGQAERGSADADVDAAAAGTRTEAAAGTARDVAAPPAPPLPLAVSASTAVSERQPTENKTILYPDAPTKYRLRALKLNHRVAEAFVGEDALAFYFETFSDEQILARLRKKGKLALRRPIKLR